MRPAGEEEEASSPVRLDDRLPSDAASDLQNLVSRKRQDLLKQIQDQAAMIKQLQAQLQTPGASTSGIIVYVILSLGLSLHPYARPLEPSSAPALDFDDDEAGSSGGEDSESPVQQYLRAGSGTSSSHSETIARRRRSAKPTTLGLPVESTPLGSMARLSLDLSDSGTRLGKRRYTEEKESGDESDGERVYVGLMGHEITDESDHFSLSFFVATWILTPFNLGPVQNPSRKNSSQGNDDPSILVRGVITPEEAETLFAMYALSRCGKCST